MSVRYCSVCGREVAPTDELPFHSGAKQMYGVEDETGGFEYYCKECLEAQEGVRLDV